MSKKVSIEQAVAFGSQLLKGEQLNESVMRVWNDDANTVAMSGAFAGHHQIVCSILEHKGDNSYLSKKGRLSFGIHNTFVTGEDNEGVVLVPMPPTQEDKTKQGAIVRKLKFQEPKLSKLPKKQG